MAGQFVLLIFSMMLSLSLSAESSPPKITQLWHGGMSDNYGNQPVETYAIDSRQPAVFKCDATGIPEPVFVWTKNGSRIVDGGRISLSNEGKDLSISNPTFEDNGLYQCNATSSKGTALSKEISASLAFMDPFKNLLTSTYNKRPNEKLVIKCDPPNSYPKLKIQWGKKKDFTVPKYDPITYTERVSQSAEGDLIFGNIIADDAGFYVCQVNNEILSRIQDSPAKRIIVSGEPTGDRPPEWVSYTESPFLAIAGSDISLTCIAEGYPTPGIDWVGVPDDDRFTTANFQQQLLIKDVQLKDAGGYQCVAFSGDQELTIGLELNVEAAPSWITEPSDVEIAPDETGSLTCVATGVPTPTITWLLNGADIPQDPRRTISGNTLTITGATTDDNSVYQCVAENDHGKIMADALFSVNVIGADIVNPPEVGKQAAEGDSVTLRCEHIGRPSPEVIWTGKSGSTIISDDKYTINENGSLIIKNVAKEDEGNYRCKVTNEGGEDMATGSIVLRTKTTIVMGVGDATVKKPESVTLNCSATKDARADITWSWIANDIVTDDVSHNRFRYNSDRSKISILRTKVTDTGSYCCIASTTYDSAKSCGTLTVQDVPTAPYNVLALKRGDSATSLSWQPSSPKNSRITNYIIEYNTTYVDVPWREIKRVPGSTTSTSLNLPGGQTFFFRVAALSAVGQSSYGVSSNSITTPPSAPVSNPTNVVGQSNDPSTMVISWDAMDVTEYGGSGFMYKVEYKNDSSSTWTATMVPANKNSMTITDTQVYQKFQIKVTAINDEGEGPPSEIFIGYSGEGTPEAAPGNVNVNVTSPTSAVVTFDPVPPESLQGKFKYYRVYYNEAIAQTKGARQSVECEKSPCEINNLKPSTEYELSVVVANSKKEGPPGPVTRFSTPEAPPGQPLNFEIVILSKKMKLFWSRPNRGGEVDSYRVKYSVVNEDVVEPSTNLSFGPEQMDCIIESLTPETTYIVTVEGQNTAGYGQQDLIEIATKKSGVPSKPILSDIKTGKEEASVIWTEDKTGPAVEKYIVKYKKKGDDTDWITKEVHVFDRKFATNLTDLASGTTYQVQIVAMSEDGQKTEGSINTFTTIGTASPTVYASVNPASYIMTDYTTVVTNIPLGSTPIADAVVDDAAWRAQPWLIVTICLILLLLIILLILCYVKSQKGGKYNVSDKEDKLRGDPESAPLKDDEGGFEEYKPKGPENNQPIHEPEEEESSDEDSLAGYADGITGNFDEDGSFIGQYSDKRKKAEDTENNAMQSLV